LYLDIPLLFTDFNPLSPHGERQGEDSMSKVIKSISIHSPLTGRDKVAYGYEHREDQFQSTLPSRGETQLFGVVAAVNGISIHSPLTGRDVDIAVDINVNILFQSTLPSRGETQPF